MFGIPLDKFWHVWTICAALCCRLTSKLNQCLLYGQNSRLVTLNKSTQTPKQSQHISSKWSLLSNTRISGTFGTDSTPHWTQHIMVTLSCYKGSAKKKSRLIIQVRPLSIPTHIHMITGMFLFSKAFAPVSCLLIWCILLFCSFSSHNKKKVILQPP